MSNLKSEIINQRIEQYESAFSKFFFQKAYNLNTFFYDMLNDYSISPWIPILSCLFQYIHIFFFIFKENVSHFNNT